MQQKRPPMQQKRPSKPSEKPQLIVTIGSTLSQPIPKMKEGLLALPKPIGRQKEVLALPPHGHFVVLGTAGSGKTTIAILRAAFLANPRAHHAGRTLLLTFNRTLVTYLRHLGDAALGDVVVENYHRFARGYLRSRGVNLNGVIANDNDRQALIEQAYATRIRVAHNPILDSGPDFVEEEIRWIQQNGISSVKDYAQSARQDRLPDAAACDEIWVVFQAYLEARTRARKAFDWHDLATAVSEHLWNDKTNRRYKHIVIDEGQDFSPEMIRSLALAVPPDGSVTLFADAAQQIYGHRISWRSAGLKISEPWKFQENYRNSRQIARLALAISKMPFFKDVPDIVEPKEPLADGPLPTLVRCRSADRELAFVADQAREAGRTRTVAILLRRASYEARIRKLLPRSSVRLDRDLTNWPAQPGISFGTYHASKGIEFDTVILPFCDSDLLPDAVRVAAYGRAEAMSRDGRLFYVGVTRARVGLIMTYRDEATKLLPQQPSLYQTVSL